MSRPLRAAAFALLALLALAAALLALQGCTIAGSRDDESGRPDLRPAQDLAPPRRPPRRCYHNGGRPYCPPMVLP